MGCDPSDLLPENMSGTKTFSYGTGYYNPNYCGVHEGSSKPYTDEDLALHEGLLRLRLAHQQSAPWWVSIGVHRATHQPPDHLSSSVDPAVVV